MTVARKITYSLAFALVVVVTSGIASIVGLKRLTQTSRWVQHTNQTLEQLSTLTGLDADLRAGTRSFVLTGREDLLEPYHRAMQRLPEVLSMLDRLTSDEPLQEARFREIEAIIRERVAYAANVIEARRAGGMDTATTAIVAVDRSEELRKRERSLLERMEGEERRVLAERIAGDRTAEHLAYGVTALSSLGTLLLVVFGALLWRRAVARPAAALLDGVERIARGDLTVRLEERTNDEFARLARAFNQMVRTRRAAEDAVLQSNAQLDTLIQVSPMAIVGIDGRGNVDVWNPAAEHVYGWKADEVIGRRLPAVPPEQRDDFQAVYRQVLEHRVPVVEIERKRLRRDGTVFDARVVVAPRVRDGVVSGVMALVEDITARKTAAEALSESEERFRLAFAEAPVGMAVVALDGRFLRVNAALCETVGYTAEELTQLRFQDITHPDDVEAGVDAVRRLLRGEIVRYQVSKRYVRKDGEIVDILLSVSVLHHPSGAPRYFVSQMEDVTERNRANEALRRSEEALNRAQRVAHLGSWEHDLRTGETSRSAEVYAIYGVERSEYAAADSMWQLVHPEDVERVRSAVDAALRDVASFSLEHRVIRPSGEERTVRLAAECETEHWIPVRMTGTILDITDIRRAEREREELLRWLRQVLDASPVGLVLFHGPRGERIEANQHAQEMIGRAVARLPEYGEIILTPDGQPVPQEDFPSRRALRGERFACIEYGLRDTQGRVIPVGVGAAPVFDEKGNVEGAVVALQDITPLKDLERLRAEWNSVIAHDLRQPLNTISLNAQVLSARAPRELAHHLEAVRSASRRLERMIGDLMDLSRLDARKLTVSRDIVDLPALVQASVDRVVLGAPDRRFEVQISEDVPRVDADADRVNQVMDNLLTNAVKYSHPGTPVVVGVAPGDDGVAVSVTNEGSGIAPEELPHLFRRFHRTDEARRSGVTGIGLGLYIARELIEAQGGHITAESTPGASTTFRFTLPVHRRAA